MNILVVTSNRPWEVLEPLAETEATVWSIEVDPSTSMLHRFLGTLRECRLTIREHEIDVVVLDVYEVPGLAAWLVAKLEGLPVVVRLVGDRLHSVTDDHLERARELGTATEWLTYSAMREMNRPIITRADGALVVSTDLKEKLRARIGFEEREVQVVPVPFRPEAFRTADPDTYRFRPDEEVIITVTNLKYPGKFAGVKQSLSAIESVLRRRDRAHYIVAGGGPYVEELRTYVDETVSGEIRDRITIAGFVDDVGSLYAVADVMVYISYLDGYPNAVLEAQGMGVPVVANAAFGMIDQIDHMETGLLVDSAEITSITEAIMFLLENNRERERIRKNAQTVVASRNVPEEIGKKYIEALVDILSIEAESNTDKKNSSIGKKYNSSIND